MKEQVFMNDPIHDGDVIIFVFKTDGISIDNGEDFHMKSIKQASFFDFIPFLGWLSMRGPSGRF